MVFLFLDTNIIQALHDFGEFIYDNYLSNYQSERIKQEFGSKMLSELDALRQIVFVIQRGSLPVAISVKSLRELLKISNQPKRDGLASWNFELIGWWGENKRNMKFPEKNELEEATELVASGKLGFLKHFEDRFLIAEALVLECDTFLTLDRRTILVHKEELTKFGIDALSPREFVDKYQQEMSGV